MSPALAGLAAAVSVMTASIVVFGAPAVVGDRSVRRRLRRLERTRSAVSPGARRDVPSSPWHRAMTERVAGFRHRDPRLARRADQVIPPLLDGVARELRSGSSLGAAVAVAAADVEVRHPGVDPGSSGLVDALARGVSVAVAVAGWRDALPTPARRLAGTAMTVAAETGGATAAVLDGVADTLRDRVALEREVAALSSQARASATLLVVAPIVVAVVAAVADERIAAFLLGSPAGWACIVGGVLLDAAGAVWMRFTVERAT